MAVTRKRPTLPKLNGKPSGQKTTHGHPRRDAEPKPKLLPKEKKSAADGVKRNKWGKKPKPEVNDEDDSGYDEAPAAGSDEEEDGFGFDLTAELAGTTRMSRFARPVGKASASKVEAMEVDEEAEEEEEVDEDEDAEIMAMMGKKSVQNGVSTVKAALGKGKSKEAKTMVGGGSWQSMGAYNRGSRSSKLILRRPCPTTAAIPSPTWLQDPHPDPTCLHPARHRPTTTRSRRHGANWFRKDTRLHHSPVAASRRQAFAQVWRAGVDPLSVSRTRVADSIRGEGDGQGVQGKGWWPCGRRCR